MLTADKNLTHQQNLTSRALALVVLGTNDWNVLKTRTSLIAEALDRAVPGSFQVVRFDADGGL